MYFFAQIAFFTCIVKVIVCPDKFKGSLRAIEVCRAMAEGVLQVYPSADVQCFPMADGGEGTCALLTEWHEGKEIDVTVHGPLFKPVVARYGLSGDGHTAFIEMAQASGLTLLSPNERNPLLTSSFGTGELIADALKRNVKEIILGLGGSATNDAGIGMAAALGFAFCDASGETLKATGEDLIHIRHVRTDRVNQGVKDVSFIALCDVTNPLYGPDGAAFVYGPQKGGDRSQLELLDAGLRNFRRVVHKYLKISVDFPGAGAAGGLGAGSRAFLSATIQRGVTYVINSWGLPEKMRDADLIITGEGKVDHQTFSGKVVSEIASLASREGKTVIAVCGKCDVPQTETRSRGIHSVISLVDQNTSEQSAMNDASSLITQKVSAELRRLANL